MSADPHYWLGWLTVSIARAVKVEKPQHYGAPDNPGSNGEERE